MVQTISRQRDAPAGRPPGFAREGRLVDEAVAAQRGIPPPPGFSA